MLLLGVTPELAAALNRESGLVVGYGCARGYIQQHQSRYATPQKMTNSDGPVLRDDFTYELPITNILNQKKHIIAVPCHVTCPEGKEDWTRIISATRLPEERARAEPRAKTRGIMTHFFKILK